MHLASGQWRPPALTPTVESDSCRSNCPVIRRRHACESSEFALRRPMSTAAGNGGSNRWFFQGRSRPVTAATAECVHDTIQNPRRASCIPHHTISQTVRLSGPFDSRDMCLSMPSHSPILVMGSPVTTQGRVSAATRRSEAGTNSHHHSPQTQAPTRDLCGRGFNMCKKPAPISPSPPREISHAVVWDGRSACCAAAIGPEDPAIQDQNTRRSPAPTNQTKHGTP